MSFLKGSVSYLRFKVDGPRPDIFGEDHLASLGEHMAGRQRVASADGVECGWSAGDSILDTDFQPAKNVVNDALCFDLRIDTNKLPADRLKAYYEVELKALAKENSSGLPSARQKREAKEIARERLEGEAADGRYRKHKCVPVLWDRESNSVLFGATSLAHVDRLCSLFEQTFGASLTAVTAGRFGSSHAIRPVRIDPSPFVPNVTPADVAWIADTASADFLGNEFLHWLWYTGETDTDTVTVGDGSEVTFMLSNSLTLECPRGQSGTDGFRHEGPSRLPEARRAAQAGKLPRRAGLILVHHDQQYTLTLHAETLAVGSAKLPKSDDATTGREALEARVTAIRGLVAALDWLYGAFLKLRLGSGWADALAGMQKWLTRGERQAA